MVAEPEFVMLSKAKMAIDKNRTLLLDYISSEPNDAFFSLCEKYKVDLTSILKG
jgi:hypothetical protein